MDTNHMKRYLLHHLITAEKHKNKATDLEINMFFEGEERGIRSALFFFYYNEVNEDSREGYTFYGWIENEKEKYKDFESQVKDILNQNMGDEE